MSTSEQRILVVIDTTPPELVAEATESEDLVIVVDGDWTPITFVQTRLIEITDLPDRPERIQTWWEELGDRAVREDRTLSDGEGVEVTTFQLGSVSRSGQTYRVQLAATGSYDGILPGDFERPDLHLFCDDFNHLNVVGDFSPDMLCVVEPPAHPIRRKN